MNSIAISQPDTNVTNIKQSINEFKSEIAKFLNNPYHSIKSITKIYSKLGKLENKLEKTEIKNNTMLNPQPLYLPILQKTPNDELGKELSLNSNKSNFNLNKTNSATLLGKEQRLFHIKRKLPDNPVISSRRKLHKEKIEYQNIIDKYGINKNDEVVNYRERSFSNNKVLKRKVDGHDSYRKVNYNNFNKPILVKEDFKGGLFEMVNRGLIPKNADLSLAFAKNGNPFKLVLPSDSNTAEQNIASRLNTSNYKKLEDISIIDTNIGNGDKKGTSLFITGTGEQKLSQESDHTENNKKILEGHINVHVNIKNSFASESKVNKYTENIASEDMYKFILFKDFKVVENKDFISFKRKNIEQWSVISYLIKVLEKLFKNLNVQVAEVDSEKLRKLATDELKAVSKMDLIHCLSDHDIKLKGFNKASKLFSTVKEASSVTIQKVVKGFIVRKRFKRMKDHHKKICRIQTFYRLYRIINISKSLIQDKLNKDMEQWQLMMNSFRENWQEIKHSKRVEIHINSLSYDSDVNCTISKYTERQNNQMSRLIRLRDPNIEIIYISPYVIPEDVVNFYFSILKTIGISDVKERVHFVVPDTNKSLPPNFNLASLLFYSTSACKKIMNIIKDKNHYIVPGAPSTADMRLSLYIESPILYIENEASNNLFTKSGAKRVFEINDLATPIGEWDIRGKDILYSKLASLITNYSSIDIWILKIDNEFNSRGTAYFQINHSKHLVDLKKDRQAGAIDSDKFESMVEGILRSTLHKKIEIQCKNLHKSGEEFLNEIVDKGGIIEACPTYLLSGIIGSPAISFLIEPDGSINEHISYDRISANYFSTIAAVSPQTSIQNLVSLYF